MGNGLADLDRALDDTIKMKKNFNHGTYKRDKPAPPVARSQQRLSNINTNKKRKERLAPSKPNSTFRGRNVSSPTINTRIGASINTRLSGNKNGIHKMHNNASHIIKRGTGVRGPIGLSKSSTSKPAPVLNSKFKTKIDPAQLVITKPIINKPKKTFAESLVINRNIGKSNQQQQRQHQAPKKREKHDEQLHQRQQQQQPSYNNKDYQQSSYRQSTPPPQNDKPIPPPVNQKNIVLLCNLDPRVSAQDVGETCSVFGPVLSCDMLLDPMGRPLNEAEIEFMYPDSAEECVAKLDNNFADGRILRARLQEKPTVPVVPRYSSRTVGASARVGSGGFHGTNDLGSNVQQQQQQQPHYQSSYHQQSHHYHPQYQRRY